MEDKRICPWCGDGPHHYGTWYYACGTYDFTSREGNRIILRTELCREWEAKKLQHEIDQLNSKLERREFQAQPYSFRLFTGICGLCAVISGMMVCLHGILGFLPEHVAAPWTVATIGFFAAVGGMVLLIEKVNGKPL